MYKIKIEERENKEKVVIYYKVEEGTYKQKIQYKIDLSDKTYSLFEYGEEKFIEWEAIEDEIDLKLEDLIRTVENKIINNRQIIYSSKTGGRENEVIKAEKHLDQNRKVLEFLKNYNNA